MNPYLLGGVILTLLASHTAMYVKGRLDGAEKHENKELKTIVQKVENYDIIQKEVILLPNADLKRRYCYWMRDDKDQCLQADIPISE